MCKSYDESLAKVREVYRDVVDASADELNDQLNMITLKRDVLLYGYILQNLYKTIERHQLYFLVGKNMKDRIETVLFDLRHHQTDTYNENDHYINFCSEFMDAIRDGFNEFGFMNSEVPYAGITGFDFVAEINLLYRKSGKDFPTLSIDALNNLLNRRATFNVLDSWQQDDIVGAVYHVAYDPHWHFIWVAVANKGAFSEEYIFQTITIAEEQRWNIQESTEVARFLKRRKLETLPILLNASDTEDRAGSARLRRYPYFFHIWPTQAILLFNHLKRLNDEFEENRDIVAENFFEVIPPNRQDHFITQAAVERLEKKLRTGN